MKKIIAMLLCISLLMLAACGGANGAAPASQHKHTAENWSADQKDHSCQTEGAGVALFVQSNETGEHPEQSDDPHAAYHIQGFDEYGGIKKSDQRRRQKGKKLDGWGILFPGIAVGSGKKIPQKVHQAGAVGDE